MMQRCACHDQDRLDECQLDPELLLVMVKGGDPWALARLLARYRNYMRLLVRLQLGRRVRADLDIEQLLDEISLELHHKSAQFRGVCEQEFLTWMRGLIGSVLAKQLRRCAPAQCRELWLERSLTHELDESSRALNESFVAKERSPSRRAGTRDPAVLLADALQELSKDDREVIILRQLEGLQFPEVARRLGRAENSVKNLWPRALARLRSTLEGLR